MWFALKPGDVVSVLPELCECWRWGLEVGGQKGKLRDCAAVTPTLGGRPGQPKLLPINPLIPVSLLWLLPQGLGLS